MHKSQPCKFAQVGLKSYDQEEKEEEEEEQEEQEDLYFF